MRYLRRALLVLNVMAINFATTVAQAVGENPNFILIMADDLGYGDLGCYGQKVISTPNLDQLAQAGTRYTQFYSGSPVCAPARSVLMTGLHTGHTTVRGNFGVGGVVGLGGGDGRVPLRDEDITIAEVLQEAGYYTGMAGKWGLGEPGTSGLPNDQGFDVWFGHLNQRRAHSHFPDYLWLNKEKFLIPENSEGRKQIYSHGLFTDFALKFIEDQAEDPFFLYLPYLVPHAAYEIPSIDSAYRHMNWSEDEKVHASMVRRLDRDVGRLVALLDSLGLREKTVIIFTSDNGAAQRWDGTFDSSGPLRGQKRDVYEGGIRAPLIISLPGKVDGGSVDSTPWYMADILPTLTSMAGGSTPGNLDGVDASSLLLGQGNSGEDRIFYWEFHEQGGKQAVRRGNWKAVRLDVQEKGFHHDIELYDLSRDPGEMTNLAEEHPGIVEEMITIMAQEHTYSSSFPFASER